MNPRPPRRRRFRLALAATAIAFLGGVLAPASPAHAASSLSFCFKWSNGTAYSRQPVYLMSWSGSRWVSERKGATGSNGCGTFSSVRTDRYTTVKAYVVFGDANIGLSIWEGWAPYYANPGRGSVSLGTGWVSRVSCVPGLYTGTCP